ncbi:conjugal transfer protein [Streptomyces sp. NBC_00876]|uniref:conjugal transfer protein n=1 Tax=Streptomyces sp. NBC_00876 TaxID=2975853 RepID=UPI00386F53ED|nr:conjugal transfer protein [Streptomyces sp. NBC_00876]
MKRGLKRTDKKKQPAEQAPAKPRATRTSRYDARPQEIPEAADDTGQDEMDEAATGWQQTTVKMAGITKLITFGVWALILAGPAIGVFAVAVAGSSKAAPPTTASQTQGQPSATGPAGFAELYLTAYLAAGEGTEDDLTPFYSEPVALANEPGSRHATSTTTVAAEQVSKGYWAVTVAARISAKNKAGKTIDQGLHYFRVGVQVSGSPEAGGTAKPATPATPTGTAGSAKPTATAGSPKPSGSAGTDNPSALYAATSLPAEVNAPTSAAHGDLAYGSDLGVNENDPVADTVSRFFAAYLTGQGELNRYVAPGLEVAAIVPAPYKSTLVTGLQDDQDKTDSNAEDTTVPADGTKRHVLVSVSATTDGQDYLLTYALTLSTRDGRWEVAAVDTAPVLAPGQTGPVADGTSPTTSPSPDASADSAED